MPGNALEGTLPERLLATMILAVSGQRGGHTEGLRGTLPACLSRAKELVVLLASHEPPRRSALIVPMRLVHRITAFAFAFAMAIPRCQWRHRCVVTLGEILLGARLRGRMATQRSKKGSEKVLGRVLGKGSQKGSEKGACYGFYSKKGF